MSEPLTNEPPDDDAIHGWFGLSYASYLVVPRSILQSMPPEWQRDFVRLLNEMNEHYPQANANYWVRAREGQHFVSDPYRDYERGRRFIEPVAVDTRS